MKARYLLGRRIPAVLRWLVASVIIIMSLGQMSLPVSARQADSFLVNDVADLPDFSPGDGICETTPGGGVCTLRAAIQEANAHLGLDTITISPGTYVLSLSGIDDDLALTGDLDIFDDVIIQGFGSDQTVIDGAGTNRIFHIFSDSSVEIYALSMRNGDNVNSGGAIFLETSTLAVFDSSILGNHASFNGGAIDAFTSTLTIKNTWVLSNTADSNAGGIYNNGGVLYVTDSLIGQNQAGAYNGGGLGSSGKMTIERTVIQNNVTGSHGGGIFSSGSLTITQSTISGNQALINGGGIYNDLVMTMTNTTISGNTADNGGGIYNGGNAAVSNATVALNTAQAGGGVYEAGAILFRYSIFSDNLVSGNCNQAMFSLGYNISSDASCAFSNVGDRDLLDPKLGPLQMNGGPTPTHALAANSQAIDAGDPTGCLDGFGDLIPVDQRGFPRPVIGPNGTSAVCDIGAYEYTTTDLVLAKTAGSLTAVPGMPITYTITLTNTGLAPVMGAILTDTFTAELSGVQWQCSASSGSSCYEASGIGNIFTSVDLAAGGAAVLTAAGVISTTASGQLENSAQAAVPFGVIEIVTGNNNATDIRNLVPEADLTLGKLITPDPVAPGGVLTYTLQVSNLGPSLATSLVVTDSLPSGTTFLSASGMGWSCTLLDAVVTCSRASLPVGSIDEINIRATAPLGIGVLENRAGVQSGVFDPNEDNNHQIITSTVTLVADLAIGASSDETIVNPGGQLTYTLSVTNTGPSPASSLEISATLPVDVAGVAVQGDGWTCSTAVGTVSCTRNELGVAVTSQLTLTMQASFLPGKLDSAFEVSASTSDLHLANNYIQLSTLVNHAPEITDIADLVMFQTDMPVTIGFMVTDTETLASDLVITSTTSNLGVLPLSNISLGGSGQNRYLTVTPDPFQTGETTVTLAVSDGLLTSQDTFNVVVLPGYFIYLPSLARITDAP